MKVEGIKSEYKEGRLEGVGGKNLTNKVDLVGISIAIEQQLQIQNGVQVSSPQPLECMSWSETC